MKRTLMATAFIALTLPVAQADECQQAEDQATMNRCAGHAYQASDAELNKLFHAVRHRLGDDAAKRHLLRGAETAWTAFRDAECSFAASSATGGSAYTMVYDQCLNHLTRKRIEEFRKYLDCSEGGENCPVPAAQ